jgi:hypothetical protein
LTVDNPNRPDPNRTHTEAVEKVAEAIWAANNRNPVNTHWLHAPDRLREPYRRMAVAAMNALKDGGYRLMRPVDEEDCW